MLLGYKKLLLRLLLKSFESRWRSCRFTFTVRFCRTCWKIRWRFLWNLWNLTLKRCKRTFSVWIILVTGQCT